VCALEPHKLDEQNDIKKVKFFFQYLIVGAWALLA
jgi:hypothetical protein